MMDVHSIKLPYRIEASRKKAALILLGAGALVAISFSNLSSSEGINNFDSLVDWTTILFFGVCAAAAIVMLVTRLPALVLSEQGFTIENWYGRKQFMAWHEIAEFGVWSFAFIKLVGYRTYRERTVISPLYRFNRMVSGFDKTIDSGTLKVEELADLMNALRARFVQSN